MTYVNVAFRKQQKVNIIKRKYCDIGKSHPSIITVVAGRFHTRMIFLPDCVIPALAYFDTGAAGDRASCQTGQAGILTAECERHFEMHP
jgi:hypothetical protein